LTLSEKVKLGSLGFVALAPTTLNPAIDAATDDGVTDDGVTDDGAAVEIGK